MGCLGSVSRGAGRLPFTKGFIFAAAAGAAAADAAASARDSFMHLSPGGASLIEHPFGLTATASMDPEAFPTSARPTSSTFTIMGDASLPILPDSFAVWETSQGTQQDPLVPLPPPQQQLQQQQQQQVATENDEPAEKAETTATSDVSPVAPPELSFEKKRLKGTRMLVVGLLLLFFFALRPEDQKVSRGEKLGMLLMLLGLLRMVHSAVTMKPEGLASLYSYYISGDENERADARRLKKQERTFFSSVFTFLLTMTFSIPLVVVVAMTLMAVGGLVAVLAAGMAAGFVLSMVGSVVTWAVLLFVDFFLRFF